jgi:endo-1,4-beta-D-glucanase Y
MNRRAGLQTERGVESTQRRKSWLGSRSLLCQCLALLLLASLWISIGCRAEQPWTLWQSYATRFLDDQGRVIDHSANDGTTTEGEAYAMFFALVANDRPRFDKLVDWTQNNLAQGDLTLHLPAWKWGKAPDGSWRVLDTNSAADADLWMAYSLCEAGRLWHNDRYASLGKIMADNIAHAEVVEVPGVGTTVLPGETGFHPDPITWYLNPSYMPPSLLAYFSQFDPVWSEVAKSLPTLVASRGGYVMDWITADKQGVHPMPPPLTIGNGKPAPTPVGSYDAIRVYLWMGIANPDTPGVSESLPAMHAMAIYLKNNAAPPKSVDPAGVVVDPNGPTGFSAAVIPYLHALHLKQEQARQVDRLNATRDPKTGLYGQTPEYYEQNLALFEDGWASGRYKFDQYGKLHVKWK